MRLLNILLGHAAIFGIAVFVSSSCSVDYPVTAFRCSPGGSSPNCPDGDGGDSYICCSDDPAAIRLSTASEFVTPNYAGRGGEGIPIFSGGNNPLSKQGMCVREGSVPVSGALADVNAQGCPVPCNPTWGAGDITAVCGDNTICCQTVELDPADCVLDPDAGGGSGCWRPATGLDIADGLTNWGGTAHFTHQDPSGTNCQTFVAGVPTGLLDENGLTANELEQECYRRLTVSNQRGFCLGGSGVNFCPLAQPGYRDACEQRNDAEGRTSCTDVDFP